MRHRRDEVGARHDHRDAEEVRRMQCDLAPDPLALQQLLEQLLAAAFGVHDRVLHFQERL